MGHGERVLTQQTEDVTILLKLNDGAHYAVNEVGGRLWELLDGNRSVSSVVATLYEEYDAPAEVVKADALELLVELTAEQLVVESQ